MKDVIKILIKIILFYIINKKLVNQAITILNYDDTLFGNLSFKSDLQKDFDFIYF